jgi:hypothetical protein
LKDQWLSASFFIAFILAGASDNAVDVRVALSFFAWKCSERHNWIKFIDKTKGDLDASVKNPRRGRKRVTA